MKALWNKFTNWLNTGNHLLWVSIIALMVIGLFSVYFVGAYDSTRLGFEPSFLFNKYWLYALVGFLFMLGCSRLSKKAIIRISWIWGAIGLLFMLLTLIDPWYVNGSSRYVRILMWTIDPFVMTLPAYIVLMSHWLSKDLKKTLWSMTGISLLTMFIIVTALKAPYVFMALVYSFVFIFMTFKARKNIPSLYKIWVSGAVIAVALIVLTVIYMPHVQARFFQIINGYPEYTQVWYSVNAIKHSTFIGNTPESLRFLSILPESSIDFMFSGIVAKFGILMGLLVLALYGFMVKGLARIIHTTKDKFNELLATGTLGLLLIYVVSSVFTAFGILAHSSVLPFVSFMAMPLLAWSVLFGFALSSNKK